jgi:hypothetical protein
MLKIQVGDVYKSWPSNYVLPCFHIVQKIEETTKTVLFQTWYLNKQTWEEGAFRTFDWIEYALREKIWTKSSESEWAQTLLSTT